LLDHKADVNHADVDNLRPILIACRAGHVDILNLLLQCLLDPRMHDISVVCQLDMRILLHMLYEEMYYRLCRIDLHLPLIFA
jgi:hypothetical protein